jgi:hypothetical protein
MRWSTVLSFPLQVEFLGNTFVGHRGGGPAFISVFSYTITILHQLLTYTSMNHSLLQTSKKRLRFNSLDTLSDVRIKAFMLLF